MSTPSFTEWLAALPAGWLEAVQHGFPFELEELEEGSSSSSPSSSRSNRLVKPREGFALEFARLGSSAEFARLPEDQKRQFIAKLSTQKVTPKRPRMARIDDLIRLDNKKSDGLLGRLVSQYWTGQQTRSWYMTRTGAYAWDDDTPLYLSKDNPWHSNDKYASNLKDSRWYGVGHTENYWQRRYYGKDTGSFSRHRGRASLESTFSNWSAPCFIANPRDNYPGWRQAYDTDAMDDATGHTYGYHSRWSHKFPYEKKFWPGGGHVNPAAMFADGSISFYEHIREMQRQRIFWGYHNIKGEPVYGDNYDTGKYNDVTPLKSFDMSTIPWRRYDLVSESDRSKANYKWKNANGDFERTAGAWTSYYCGGYGLVRTVLDVVLARGHWDVVKSYPAFARHCNWWWIPVPTRDLAMRAPDLSAIGGGVAGLADVSTSDLIEYVMKITPPPGTIPPWEDQGPLWTWPSSTGSMRVIRAPDGTMTPNGRDSSDWWGTIVQFVLGVEISICANVASGVVSEAVDVVLEQAIAKATELTADWLASGVEQVLEAVDSTLGGAALDAAKEAISNCSAFAANVRNFTNGTALLGGISGSSDLAGQITDYLDKAADDASSVLVAQAKKTAEKTIEGIRETWDWADDLIGSASSWGANAANAVNSI